MSQQAGLKPICAGFRTEGMKKKKPYGTEGDDRQAWLGHIGLMVLLTRGWRL